MGTEITTGTLGGRLGYLRFGSGPRTLVVLPGLILDNEAPSGLAARAYVYGFRALTANHTVHVVRRPRGLPVGTRIADLAAEYAEVLRAELGRADVVGVSTGGLIAQELALGHPETVDRLALVVSGNRMAEPGRRLARTLVRRSGLPDGPNAADFVITTEATLAHDTTDRLAGLSGPALLVGGVDDPFFPEPVLRATAGTRMQLRLLPGGHGVPKRHAGRLQAELAAFFTP